MTVTSATFTDASGSIIAALISGLEYSGIRAEAVSGRDGDIASMIADWIDAGNTIAPYVAPPPAIPTSVSPNQARVALHAAGLLPSVQSAIASAPVPAQIAWEYATVFERHSPFIEALAPMLGLSDAQIDDLFIAASQV